MQGTRVVAMIFGVLLAGGCSDDNGSVDGTATTVAAATTTEVATNNDDGAVPTTTAPVLDLPPAYVGYTSVQYGEGANWLCHPDDADENVCERDLDATAVTPDGSTAVEPHVPTDAPTIDCFYVYPTISTDPGLNSDLDPGDGQEVRAVVNQVARLGSVCEVFAPVYRQMTIGSLAARLSGEAVDETEMDAAREIAYGDVLDAWKQYLANDNEGRGVILIGHSQGAGVLTRLVSEEIDNEPLVRDRLVAAYLLGTSLAVPEGADVGGAFDNIPLCRANDQIGCVVTYASYPASSPPGDDALFGQVAEPGMVAGCTNPAALAGGSATLIPYFTAEESAATLDELPDVESAWVSLRDVFTAECQVRDGHTVLEVTVAGDPTDARDQRLTGGLPLSWGLHLADVNVAMGNLVALAADQARTYAP